MGDAQVTPARKAIVDRLTSGIEEARTASLSLYVIADRSDYAPLRSSGQRLVLSGGKVISTNERKQAQEIADEVNAQYRASKLDRQVEVMETLAWRARRVERLVELLASAEMTRGA
jgi:hypothetical protein